MKLNINEIGKRLSRLRKSRGFTQEELAEKINRSERFISKIETGKSQASIETLVFLCDALKTTPDHILLGSSEHEKNNQTEKINELLPLCDDTQLFYLRRLIEAMIEKHHSNSV